MGSIWILIADRSRARILSARTPAARKLSELKGFVHPEAQLKRGDLETDRPGSFRDEGQAAQSGEPQTDYKHYTAERFAGEVVEYLDKARTEGKFDRLVIVAAPLFLGVLRDKMPDPLVRTVGLEIDKDLTRLKPQEIRKFLPEHL